MCQPRELLVDVLQEYPDDTEHMYVPSCVVLNRCGGCCTDEAMECVPTETRNITLQVRQMVFMHIWINDVIKIIIRQRFC